MFSSPLRTHSPFCPLVCLRGCDSSGGKEHDELPAHSLLTPEHALASESTDPSTPSSSL